MADEKAVNDKLNVTTVDKSKRMFLGMKKRMKRPPVVRNQAVQSVGELYFQIAMTGLIVAAVLAIVTVAMGSNRGMFKFRLDRCDCYLTSSSQVHVDAGASCVFDQDHIGVNIGWKSFNIEEAVTTSGCLDGWEGVTDIGTPFGDGIYEKKTTTYGNGATGAADACVGLFVVSAFMCIIMYKTVKMSYSGPGSIYSVGLHNIALMCLALSIASGISVAAFWGRVQGKLGTMSNSLAATLFKATLDVCEGAWDDVDAGQFCDASPWTFEVPLFAGWLAIAHVTAMFITAVWILSKSAFVEGVLDGSIMTDGKTVTPRMVEFENAVGRALATTEDPDYDIQDNQLYTGEQKIMIRPYPLPGTAVKKVMKAAEALVSPLRELSSPKQGVSPSTASQRASESSGSGKFSTPRSGTVSGEPSRGRGGVFGVPTHVAAGPVSPVPMMGTPPTKEGRAKKGSKKSKASKKASGKQQGGVEEPEKEKASKTSKMPKMPNLRRKSPEPLTDPIPRQKSPPVSGSPAGTAKSESGDGDTDGDDQSESSSNSVIVLSDHEDGARGGVKGKGHHSNSRSEIDWSSILVPGGGGGGGGVGGGAGGGGKKNVQFDEGARKGDGNSSGLGDLSLIDQLPSTRDGLGLGAITEDPREDMISEMTVSPRARGSASQFEV